MTNGFDILIIFLPRLVTLAEKHLLTPHHPCNPKPKLAKFRYGWKLVPYWRDRINIFIVKIRILPTQTYMEDARRMHRHGLNFWSQVTRMRYLRSKIVRVCVYLRLMYIRRKYTHTQACSTHRLTFLLFKVYGILTPLFLCKNLFRKFIFI